MRVRELALALGLQYSGDGDLEITGAASLESAESNDLAFAANPRALSAAERSNAGCIIAPAEWKPEEGRTVIAASNPRAVFAAALRTIYPDRPACPGIHPSAVVSDTAHIGNGVAIGPNVVIEAGAHVEDGVVVAAGTFIGAESRVGARSILHPGVKVYAGVSIGERCILHSGCVVGADGFGFVFAQGRYEKFPQVGKVVIEADCELGANTCVDRAALGVTRIGTGTKLDNMVHIGHNCNIGSHVVIAAQTGLSGGVVVEDYAVIGGQVGIGDKARIETRAVLGSGCGVLTSKIVRSGEVVWGTPARPLKQYLRQLAAVGRLEEMRAEIDALRQRIADLEGQEC